MENITNEKNGLLEKRIEDHHYVVKLRWKDGKENEHHFPEKGFLVVDPVSGEKKGFIKGEDAVKILENNSLRMTEEEFSWLDFVTK